MTPNSGGEGAMSARYAALERLPLYITMINNSDGENILAVRNEQWVLQTHVELNL